MIDYEPCYDTTPPRSLRDFFTSTNRLCFNVNDYMAVCRAFLIWFFCSIMLCSVLLLPSPCVIVCEYLYIIYSVFLSFSFSLVLLHVLHLYVKQAINMDYNEFIIACLS